MIQGLGFRGPGAWGSGFQVSFWTPKSLIYVCFKSFWAPCRYCLQIWIVGTGACLQLHVGIQLGRRGSRVYMAWG